MLLLVFGREWFTHRQQAASSKQQAASSKQQAASSNLDKVEVMRKSVR